MKYPSAKISKKRTSDYEEVEMAAPNKIHLDFEQEKKIQSIPSFTMKNEDKEGSGPKTILQSEYKPLHLYNIPWFFWTVGVMFITVGFLLMVNIVLKKEKKMFNGFQGKYVWEYIILVIIFLFGVSFFFAAKFEKIIVDKIEGEILLYKFYLYRFKAETLTIKIETLDSIFPTRIELAHAESTRTCINKIGFRFNETEVVYMFQTLFSYFCINTVIKLRAFIFNKLSTYASVKYELEGTETHMDVLRR